MSKPDETKQTCLVFHADFKSAIIFLVGRLVYETHKTASPLFLETVGKKNYAEESEHYQIARYYDMQ